MMTYRHALGNVIRDTRLEKNLTLRQVSSKGVISLGHLSDVERGRKEASSELLLCIAYGLGVHVHELIITAGYRLGFENGHLDAAEFLEGIST
jgi:transcriptional regulator with XRE-family HTH domain